MTKKITGIPGDLHWEYLRAGLYETQYFCNGYKYKIEKDDYYNNEWRLYYIWYYDTKRPRQWKRNGNVYRTKKEAQEFARRHNMKPRTKWKYIGRLPEYGPLTEEQAKHFRATKHYGDLMFVKCNDQGEPIGNRYYPEYISFDSLASEFTKLPKDHPARKLEDVNG